MNPSVLVCCSMIQGRDHLALKRVFGYCFGSLWDAPEVRAGTVAAQSAASVQKDVLRGTGNHGDDPMQLKMEKIGIV